MSHQSPPHCSAWLAHAGKLEGNRPAELRNREAGGGEARPQGALESRPDSDLRGPEGGPELTH